MKSDSRREIKALVERPYDAAVNEQDLALVDELLTPDFVDHGMPPGTAPGPGTVRAGRSGSPTSSARFPI